MPRPIVRVLVLDPSAQRRQRLQRLVAADLSLQVVGAVANAEQAIEAAARRNAEVILIGRGAAPLDTIATTRSIMQARATPIVVLAAGTSPPEEKQAFPLMEAGALAVLHDPIPSGITHDPAALDNLHTTLRLMAEVKVVRRWASTAASAPSPVPAAMPLPPRRRAPAAHASPIVRPPATRVELVAIGASTGGPIALKQLLCPLPASFPVPIVIVQHMADGFLHGMAEWLSASCAVKTEIAGPGTELRPGRAYLAPDGSHMKVGPNRRLVFDAGPPVNGHRPAVSCLLESVAAQHGSRAIGILLTGMGKDGAAELKLMKDAGAVTIAQDESSSVVHGMPGEAIRSGAASYVMTPEDIGAALPALVLR